jgi:hypothetical protein
MLAAFVQFAGIEGYARGFLLETALALTAIIVASGLVFQSKAWKARGSRMRPPESHDY